MPCAAAPAPAISIRWSPNRFAAGAERDVATAGDDGRRSALDVVVERAQPVAEARRAASSRSLSGSPPTGGRLRIHARDRFDEPVDERLIARRRESARCRMPR